MPNSSKPKPAQEIPWPRLLHEARRRFHIQRLRPGQREVIESVLRGRNTLAVMPTGAGKSLTFQLPALFLPHPVVVVSPLLALMEDQREKAQLADIAVEKLDSTLHVAEAAEAAHDIAAGTARLIYVTPERLQSPDFQAELKHAGGISLLVIDEAHTIAQWGHDFRPAFLAIGEARRSLGDPPILALTATATEDVVHDILVSLHAEDAARIHTGIDRDNLFFAVHPTVNNLAKQARILAMISEEQGSGIVYTASVRSANELFEFLEDHGVSAAQYHGRMPARKREAAQHAFMHDEVKVMVATKAFGLGIDKPNIRFVYHYEFPDSLETYYQEAGRAGRDGTPSRAALLYRLEDKRIQSFFLAGRYPRLEELRAVIDSLTLLSFRSAAEESASALLHQPSKRRTEVILHLLREAEIIRRTGNTHTLTADPPTDETLTHLLQIYVDRATHDRQRLADMMHYAETPDCRVQIIRAYFDQPPGDPCNHCDNCANSSRVPHDHANAERVIVGEIPSQPAVTTITTIHGPIKTTAPETLPQPALKNPFHPGDQVRHTRFGLGKVLDLHNDIALIAFPKAGQKRLRTDFLTLA